MPRRVRYAARRRRGSFRRRRRSGLYPGRRGSGFSRIGGRLTRFGGPMPLVVRAPGTPMPAKLRVRMRCQGEHWFTSASPQKMFFTANNALLPLGGATVGISDNQHRGWDQVAVMYQRAQVIAVRVILTAINVGVIEAGQIGMCLTAGAQLADSGARRVAELPYSRVAILPVAQQVPTTLILAASVQQLYGGGLGGNYLPEEFSTQTTGTSPPSRGIFLSIVGNTLDQSGTNSIRYAIVMEQVIELYDPMPLTVS